MKSVFLTAEWRHLIMANYVLDPAILQPYVPVGTELDFYEGKCYASMVGFMFLNTKIKGIGIPFHKDFEEVNLRFYVRRKTEEGWRRGVVFIKEIVPKPAIAWTARVFYREKYVYHPMKHQVSIDETYRASYSWKKDGQWQSLFAVAEVTGSPILPDTEEMFISDHYYGYSHYSSAKTKEYRVDHPVWNVHKVTDYHFNADVEKLYGQEFADPLQVPPASVFLLDGSETSILTGDFVS